MVYPAVQRFHLDGNEYFVKSDGAVNVAQCPINNGYWIVPYIILPLPLPTGEPVGRPANATEPLPESLKDAAVAAGTTTRYHLLRPVPDRDYAKLGEHFLESQDNYFTIKYDFIKKALDDAERMDYEFAVRMQGLQNCNINAVWTCTDLGFDAYDRSLMMEQFLRGYVGRFLSQVSQRPGRELDPDHVVREAIQMHEKFCEAWVQEHKRGLSPLVESCAEALVGNFCEGPLKAAELAGLTRKQISRLLRRDPVFSPQFGLCLHFFMVKLDQDRSGRNANYKSMFNSFNSNVLAMKTFENFMRSNAGHLGNYLENRLRTLATRRFDPLCIDWYGIVSQLHTPSVRYTGVNKRRRAAAAAAAGGMDGGLGPGGLW